MNKKVVYKTNGLIFSQEVLLALIKKGITREEAYQMVQKNAMKVWEQKIDFKMMLFKDEEISKILSLAQRVNNYSLRFRHSPPRLAVSRKLDFLQIHQFHGVHFKAFHVGFD